MMRFLLQFALMTLTLGYTFKFYKQFIRNDNFITSVVDISLRDCMYECADRPACSSISYNRQHHYCVMLDAVDTTNNTGYATVYGEKSWWIQISSVDQCNVTCTDTQTCDLTATNPCTYTECPTPNTVYNADSYGNMREMGARVMYECIVGAHPHIGTVISTCGADGNWSDVNMTCYMDGFVRMRVGYRYPMSGYIRDIYGDQIFQGLSRVECTSLCKNETLWCQAVSYSTINETCILVDAAWPLIEEEGWEGIHKIFPTYYAYGPNGRYTMSYNQSVEFCESRDATIAAREDVQASYDMGFNRLECGWVVEQVSILASHHTLIPIWMLTGVKQCWWQDLWGVFCKEPLYTIYG